MTSAMRSNPDTAPKATHKKLLGVVIRQGRGHRDSKYGNQKPKHTETGAGPQRQTGLSEWHTPLSRNGS